MKSPELSISAPSPSPALRAASPGARGERIFRTSIALATSLLLHIAIIVGFIGIMQPIKTKPPDVNGLMQVALHLSFQEDHAKLPIHVEKSALSSTKKGDRKPIRARQERSDTPKLNQTPAEVSQNAGRFRWRPPSTYQQSESMNAAQLQQLAFQRNAQIAAVHNGLAAVSSQLGQIITAKMMCTQQENDDIECDPEPKESERPLIIQFFNLAIQARRLGVIGNPVQMNFGEALGVSVLLR